MNVLLVNPETPESFWTMHDLVRLQGCKTLTPPLGLLTLAALLPTDWRLRLVDLDTRQLTEKDWDWAELILLTSMIVQRESMLEVIRECKQRGKTVVVGGPYPTSVPQDALSAGADIVFQGEAESNGVRQLLKAMDAKQQGIVVTITEKPDLTKSPVPRFDLLNQNDYVIMGIQTSRGCPFNCEFCDIVNLYGQKPRYKNADQVVDELETLFQLGWRREVFFVDDNFIGNKSHARSTLNKLIEWNELRGKPFTFWCQASINLGRDLALIDLMTEANFYQVFVGVESPDEEVLATTRKFQNVHNPLLESINNMKRNGLGVVGSFIIGFDGEKEGAADRICQFVELTGIPVVMLNILQAAPNTQLWNRLQAEGRLLDGEIPRLLSSDTMNFIPTRPESQIVNEFIRGWSYLYEPSKFLDRAFRYYMEMRPTRRSAALQKGESILPSENTYKDPLRRKIALVYMMFNLFFWMGIVSPDRTQFWKQVFTMQRKNPSRMVKYMGALFIGHTLYRYSTRMLREFIARQQKEDSQNRKHGTDKNASSLVNEAGP